MSDAVAENKSQRRPWLAVVLSLIMPGLGHVYCGRIAAGLVLACLSGILVPVVFSVLSVSHSAVRVAVIISTLFAYLGVWLIAIVDSWYTARRAAAGYILKDYNKWYVYVMLAAMSTAGSTQISLNVRSSLLEAFRIPKSAGSMYPTIAPGDRFLANKIAYKSTNPKRGDVIVFICPENRHWNHVKRVVAVAGDAVEMKDNDLYVNGQKLARTSLGRSALHKSKGETEGEVFIERSGEAEYRVFLADGDTDEKQGVTDFAQVTVSKHHCFVIGDNRSGSRDSRHFGPINLGLIKGRADYLYWPAERWERFGRIK